MYLFFVFTVYDVRVVSKEWKIFRQEFQTLFLTIIAVAFIFHQSANTWSCKPCPSSLNLMVGDAVLDTAYDVLYSIEYQLNEIKCLN